MFDNPDINGSHGGNKGLFDADLIEKAAFTTFVENVNAKIYPLRTDDYGADESKALAAGAVQAMERAAN